MAKHPQPLIEMFLAITNRLLFFMCEDPGNEILPAEDIVILKQDLCLF
jgi:hypothetical protein